MYCLIKWQYYWKGMNKDIHKYVTACILCHREKAKIQHYPLQMTYILGRPFNKIAINLITKCETSTSGNKHILTILLFSKNRINICAWRQAFAQHQARLSQV